jgi:hypothetical protein
MNRIVWPLEAPAHLLELAVEIPAGPWEYRRSRDGSGALIVWDDITGAAEPMLQVYAGTDVAKYLCLLSPALLFGLGVADPGQAARGLGSSTRSAQPDEPGSS